MKNDLKKDNIVKIDNAEYTVLGNIEYVSKDSPDGHYQKIYLSGHFVLIVSSSGVEFGKDLGEITEFNSFSNEVIYDGKKYTLDEHDYQFVYSVISGDITTLEGECEFWNYVADDGAVVSVGKISSDGHRADVSTKQIETSEIELIK